MALDRRRFLRRAGALGIALPLARWGGASAQPAPALVARRVFFDDPDYRQVKLSPDGAQLAWIAPLDGVLNLWVAPTSAPGKRRAVTRVTARSLSTYFAWAHNNRQLVYFEDHDGDENWRASSIDLSSGAVVALSPSRGVRALLQEVSPKFPDEVVLRHNARDKRFHDLFRVNLVTGVSTPLYENRDYAWLMTDADFRVRLGGRFDKDGSCEVFEHRADGSWDAFTTVPIGDLDATYFIDISADGGILYLRDPRGRDKAALVAIDMATRQPTVLAEDDGADIVRVEFDPASRHPVAAAAVRERVRWQALDALTQEDLAQLAAHGPGDIEFVSRSLDNTKATVFFERDAASGAYALLDRTTGRVTSLFQQRPALARVSLRPMEPVTIPARDGLSLPCYLTVPQRAASAGPGPLVMVIHGGPYWRDSWGYNGTHQWLANRGYAVLSVNFRGSTGFGKAFVTAADREWGGRMHDDLIDALDWAIARGIADPARVGFYGASYGGYSALTAATKTPERFACIVDIFGVSSLQTFMKTIPPYWGPWFSIWKNRLGDPDTEAGRAFLAERSPLTHIARATKPILIAQGLQDVRVVAAESEQMVAALQQRDVPVTYISFADEGHGFIRAANRLAFYAVAEAFLAKHLGGRHQAIGDDLAGSSLKVETGGALVPGLPG
ncbi:MAG: S9 family peptidase [Proteobacteria bacterium]|nr:S9 family peptidase [Pseudomonadota bacterium]